jgi:4-hydroxyphenylpyruvate dioxygenase-like putative hemolysin
LPIGHSSLESELLAPHHAERQIWRGKCVPGQPGSTASRWEVALPNLQGFAHVELTVRDAEGSAAWYERVLGFYVRINHRSEKAHVIVMGHRSGMSLGFWQHAQRPAKEPFDEFRTGLDHMAFRVSTRSMTGSRTSSR